jgi:hypothetical protein
MSRDVDSELAVFVLASLANLALPVRVALKDRRLT